MERGKRLWGSPPDKALEIELISHEESSTEDTYGDTRGELESTGMKVDVNEERTWADLYRQSWILRGQ